VPVLGQYCGVIQGRQLLLPVLPGKGLNVCTSQSTHIECVESKYWPAVQSVAVIPGEKEGDVLGVAWVMSLYDNNNSCSKIRTSKRGSRVIFGIHGMARNRTVTNVIINANISVASGFLLTK
jgi:hypothetical protein